MSKRKEEKVCIVCGNKTSKKWTLLVSAHYGGFLRGINRDFYACSLNCIREYNRQYKAYYADTISINRDAIFSRTTISSGNTIIGKYPVVMRIEKGEKEGLSSASYPEADKIMDLEEADCLVQKMRFEEAARIYEKWGFEEEALKILKVSHQPSVMETRTVIVNINELIRQLKEQGLTAGYICPRCGGNIDITSPYESISQCKYCGTIIEPRGLERFLRTILNK